MTTAPAETAQPVTETVPEERPAEEAPQAKTLVELQAENERLAKALKERNKEEAGRRKKLDELEKAEEVRQAASLSETDKLKKQLAEADKRVADAALEVKTVRLKSTVTNMAAQMGFQDPEDAYVLIDMAAVTVTDDGKVEGAKEALGALAKSKPYMLRKAGAGPIRTTNPDGTQSAKESDAERRKRLLG